MTSRQRGQLRALEARRRQLLELIETSTAELAGVSAAIGALRAASAGRASMPTQQAVRQYYEALPPGTHLTADLVLAAVEQMGWRSTSVDRRGAISTFLARDAGKGRLRKGVRGVYITPG